MSKLRRRRSAAQWDRLIDEFLASGESQRDFCQRLGLGLSSFNRWYRRHMRAGAAGAHAQAGAFVDVTPKALTPAPITLHFGEGLRIDCPPGMGVESVVRLARAMRDGC